MTMMTAHSKEEFAVGQFLNTSLNQKNCQRCGGLMITDRCLDIASDTGEVGITVRRCVQCGDMIDPTIIRNRSLLAADRALSHKSRNNPKPIFIEAFTEEGG